MNFGPSDDGLTSFGLLFVFCFLFCLFVVWCVHHDQDFFDTGKREFYEVSIMKNIERNKEIISRESQKPKKKKKKEENAKLLKET